MMTQVDTVYLIYHPSQQGADYVHDINTAIDAVNQGRDVFIQKKTKEKLAEAETSIETTIITRFFPD